MGEDTINITLDPGFYTASGIADKIKEKFVDPPFNSIEVAYENGFITFESNGPDELILNDGSGKSLIGDLNSFGCLIFKSNDLDYDLTNITNITGTPVEELMEYTYATSPTYPRAYYTNYPVSGSSFTAKGWDETIHVEGITPDEIVNHSAYIIGARPFYDSEMYDIDDTNNIFSYTYTDEEGLLHEPEPVEIPVGSYSREDIINYLMTAPVHLEGIEASMEGNYLKLAQIAEGDGTEFTIDETSLGGYLLFKDNSSNSHLRYVDGGTEHIDATVTGTLNLSAGKTLLSDTTIRFKADEGAYNSIDIDAGIYADTDAIVAAINSKLSLDGELDANFEAINKDDYIQLQLKYDGPTGGDGHTISLDNTCDGYEELFLGKNPVDAIPYAGSTEQTYAAGSKDISTVVIDSDYNKLNFYLDDTEVNIEITPGTYTAGTLVSEINSIFSASPEQDINHLIAETNGSKLILKFDSDFDENTHKIDRISGSAAYTVYYNGSEGEISYVKGQKDISGGVSIESNVNDNFEFHYDGYQIQVIIPEGDYTTDDLKDFFNNKFTELGIHLTVDFSDNGQIEFETEERGLHYIDHIKGLAAPVIFYNDTGSSHEDSTLYLQVGANSDDRFSVDLPKINLQILGLNRLNGKLYMSDNKLSNQAIRRIDHAIDIANNDSSRIGSYQNALEHLDSLQNESCENLDSAESRIRDADMAKEMMNMNKINTLNETAKAMLAQANQQPEAVIKLLK